MSDTRFQLQVFDRRARSIYGSNFAEILPIANCSMILDMILRYKREPEVRD